MGAILAGVTYTASDLRVAVDWYEREIQNRQTVLSHQVQRELGEPTLDLLKRELRVLNTEYQLLKLELEATCRAMGSAARHAAQDALSGTHPEHVNQWPQEAREQLRDLQGQ